MKNKSKSSIFNSKEERDRLISKDKYLLRAEEILKEKKLEKREHSIFYKLLKKIKFR